MKQSKSKSLFKRGNAQTTIEYCASTGLEYTITESNYSLSIESEFCNVSFMQNEMKKRAFIAGAKVRKDILATGLEPPEFDEGQISYFDFAPPQSLRNSRETIFNIDIKSAYASVLYNHSLITPETAKYLASLDKASRLACVGMLAAKKDVYLMRGREEIEHHEIIKDTKNWFFFCVHIIGQVMNKIRHEINRDFLFYWVDGIFFNGEKNIKKVERILNELGYKYSFSTCTEFKYWELKRERKIRYLKDGTEEKEFNLPRVNSEIHKFLAEYLGI